MLNSYLTTAYRTLWRHKGYAFITLAGLAAGIGCTLLILLAVHQDLSYDRFHPDTGRLYRVVQDVSWGRGSTWDFVAGITGPTMADEIPEVEAMARFHQISALVSNESGEAPVRAQEDHVAFVDPAFFLLFAMADDADAIADALEKPRHAVLTRSTARKYFGTADATGKTLRLDDRMDLTVSGVIPDLPENTHLDFDVAVSFATLLPWYGIRQLDSWWWPSMQTYVRLAPGSDAAHLNAEVLPAFVARHREPAVASAIVPRLQPVTDIHLRDDPGEGAMRFVQIFSAIAVFVLLIACVNYVNLSTARSARRAREVGLRKAMGAHRVQLVMQFVGESFVVAVLALILGVILADTFLPYFNALSHRSLTLDLSAGWLWVVLLGMACTVGLVAGVYPAIFLSAYAPVRVLKGAVRAGGQRLRRTLVVVQFAVTIALIAGTAIVYRQVGFMRTQTLGFNAEQVVALRLRTDQSNYTSLKSAFEAVPGVTSVSGSSWYPGVTGATQLGFVLNGKDIDDDPDLIYADFDLLQTLGIELAEGRSFAKDMASDRAEAFLMNETAAQTYDVARPTEARVRFVAQESGRVVYEKSGQVVGVVKDFHETSLHYAIRPVVITLAEQPRLLQYVLVRLASGNVAPVMDRLKERWTTFFPHRPFEASFVNDRVDALYQGEVQFGRTAGAFSLLAILIACLGLFGLASFTAEQRTKEIGVRKVLGASATGIAFLLSRDFGRLIVLAAILAIPVAYLAMNRWLADFAYRASMPWWIFAAAGFTALTLALLTIGVQTMRAATANPVKALRYE